MTRTVTDAAMLLEAIAGYDPKDSTSKDKEVPNYTHDLESGVEGLKIGVPKEYFIDGIDPKYASVDAALEFYKEQGAELVEVSLPHTEHGIATYYLIGDRGGIQ